MAETTKPLHDLLSKKMIVWIWGDSHKHSLALYDHWKHSFPWMHRSSYGLGAVLTQKRPDRSQRPVVYAWRALTPTELCYTQTEKEALALTWARERLNCLDPVGPI